MATGTNIFSTTLTAGVDLSANQWCAVAASAAADRTAILPAAAGSAVLGVLTNPAAAGLSVTVQVAGIGKILVGTTAVTHGDKISVDTAGRAVTATRGQFVLGTARVSAAAGTLVSVLLLPAGKA